MSGAWDRPPFTGAGPAGKPCPAHQHRDGVMTNPDPAAKNELSVDPVRTVALTRGRMDLTDHIGQHVCRMLRAEGDRDRHA
jgi:hypothetical protein